MKNSLVIMVVVAAALAAGYWYFRAPAEPAVSMSPSPSVTVSPTSTPKATASRTPTPRPTPSATPTPGIIIQEHQVINVAIDNMMYLPSAITARRGDVVVFRNLTSYTHTVTALGGAFDSKNIAPGGQWTLMTASLAPGTYDFHCTIYPVMRGTLTIE